MAAAALEAAPRETAAVYSAAAGWATAAEGLARVAEGSAATAMVATATATATATAAPAVAGLVATATAGLVATATATAGLVAAVEEGSGSVAAAMVPRDPERASEKRQMSGAAPWSRHSPAVGDAPSRGGRGTAPPPCGRSRSLSNRPQARRAA
eukprot:scaffold1569_cov45-Phaeocystis_antarctica.AAC.1